MGLGASSGQDPGSHPGEAGIGIDLAPPFTATDEPTRWLFSLNRFGIRPGLQRIKGVLAGLGHPELSVPSLVIAGTNGKGSTARILDTLLRAAGYHTACYTSPHLLTVHERLLIDGRPVGADRFAACVEAVRPLVEEHGASWFESLTAVAMDICREEKVDFLCCEAGLGGRLDATNALPAEATLLTTVSMDHSHILGETVPEIAAEKLGLLKNGAPLFCGVNENLKGQVFRAAVEAGSPPHFLDELCRWNDEPGPWDLTTRRGIYADLPDPGSPVLRRNVALALLALEELADAGRLRLPADVPKALGEVFLPGRFQLVMRRPDWIFDTAHNDEAMGAALETFLARPVDGRRIVLFGSMRNKELGPVAGSLLRRVDRVLAAPVRLPRSRNREELDALMKQWGLDETVGCAVMEDLGGALEFLAGELVETDSVLVLGSCFTVAEVLYRLGFHDLEETRRPIDAHSWPDRIQVESSPGRMSGRQEDKT